MKGILAAGVGAGLLFTSVVGCGSGETHPSPVERTVDLPSDPYAIAGVDERYVTEQFTRYSSMLEKAGSIATTHLLLVSGDETYKRVDPAGAGSWQARATSIARYCPPTRTAVLTATEINAARHWGKYHAHITFVIAHELGHAEQDEQGRFAETLSAEERPIMETQATCYAGRAMAQLDPSFVPTIEMMLGDIPMDQAHGTSQAQADAFMAGATTHVC